MVEVASSSLLAQEPICRKFLKFSKNTNKKVNWITGLFWLIQPIQLRGFIGTYWYKPVEVKVSSNNLILLFSCRVLLFSTFWGASYHFFFSFVFKYRSNLVCTQLWKRVKIKGMFKFCFMTQANTGTAQHSCTSWLRGESRDHGGGLAESLG